MRVIVAGYLVRGPLGGMAWHHLQYVLGLTRLGHQAIFVEESEDYPACWDPEIEEMTTDPSFGLRFTATAFERLGIGGAWAYHDTHSGRWRGPLAGEIERLCAEADLLLNLSGVNPISRWLESIPARALIDTDPAFTQVRHVTDPAARSQAERHTSFFTFGENVGRPGCRVPDDGLPWQPTRQPIVLDAWPSSAGRRDAPFTTVMQWDSYPAVEHAGVRYAVKADSFRDYMDLPKHTTEVLELALGSATAPRQDLAERGWRVRHPYRPTRDPWSYQAYIRGSKGELSVAKHGYVVSHSGWFSERTAGYLASGRPAVVQDTGFSDWLDADAGVLAFSSPDEAARALAAVDRDYDRHCRAARSVAERYFDSAIVLRSLIDRAVVRG
jgi:hypothetical protein